MSCWLTTKFTTRFLHRTSLGIQAWQQRLLYGILVGKTDKNSQDVPGELIEHTLVDLFENLKKAAGGIMRMQPVETFGDTAAWGKEPSTVVLVLADTAQEQIMDASIADQGHWIAEALSQDEIWITKQALELYVAQSAR